MKRWIVKFGTPDGVEISRTAGANDASNATFNAIQDLTLNLGVKVLDMKGCFVKEVVDLGVVGDPTLPPPTAEPPKAETPPKPPASSTTDNLSVLRQRIFQFLGVFERDKEKMKAIFRAVSGKERAHDCTEDELRKLVTAFSKLAEGSAALVWTTDKKRAGILDGPTEVLLAGAPAVQTAAPTAKDPF